ncbi:MAG: T9SS type A sorting domain-containing protein, partial [Candidatus Tenebribacter mawsonii]|nr:T9SS type A sorting domain-containing protein [Candidatus Tenebribacter mawsonii]
DLGDLFYYSTNPDPLNAAEIAIEDDNNDVSIVLGHDRKSSTAIGNHPFRFQYDTNTTFQFMHNGGINNNIKSALYTELGGSTWFTDHPSNWITNYTSYTNFIDSEILFHWIMKNIIENNGDILAGIQAALTATVGSINLENEFRFPYNSWQNVVNFVLTDGETLYVFRNAFDSWSHHLLSWEENVNNSYTIKTQSELSTSINQFDLVKITRDEYPIVFPDFFDFDLTNYEIVSLSPGWQWISYPRLNLYNTTTYDHAYYGTTSDPGLLQATDNGNRTINNFLKIEGHRNNGDINIQYLWNGFQDNGFNNELYRHEGYKIEIDEDSPATTVAISGDQLETYSLNMTELENYWLGYNLETAQNIKDAFGDGTEYDFWVDVNKVWAEDWYYDRFNMIRGGDPSQISANSTKGKTMEYGKMYIVQMYDDVDNFSWYDSSTVEEPIEKAIPESFTYTEKADYEAIDVVNIPSNVTEIGVYEGEVCVGAVVVEDSCAQILVYSDSANRDPVPFTFEVVSGRGFSTPIKDYLVLNQMTGEFESSVIISGRQGYSAIKLGELEELENIIARPVLLGNYPNPFNPTTKISFSLPNEEDIELTIYNIKGQKVRTLYSGMAEEGEHTMIWNGKDTNNKLVSSGIYFYKLKTNNKELTRKMLMMK